jgi:hypothetical protein
MAGDREDRRDELPERVAPKPTILEGFDKMYVNDSEARNRAHSASAWAGKQVCDHQRRYNSIVSPIVEKNTEASQKCGKKLDVVQGVLDEV